MALRKKQSHRPAPTRWSLERREFVISLPAANGKQAQQVAERIHTSLLTLALHNHKQTSMPSPTVSQGIVVYPFEGNEMMKLIDHADKRL